jgi:hypothetical protein
MENIAGEALILGYSFQGFAQKLAWCAGHGATEANTEHTKEWGQARLPDPEVNVLE